MRASLVTRRRSGKEQSTRSWYKDCTDAPVRSDHARQLALDITATSVCIGRPVVSRRMGIFHRACERGGEVATG